MGDCMKWHENGSRGFFPTNPDLAIILGSTDFDCEKKYLLDWWFPDVQISRHGVRWCPVVRVGSHNLVHCLLTAKAHYIYISPPILGRCCGVPGAFGLCAALDVHGYARARTWSFLCIWWAGPRHTFSPGPPPSEEHPQNRPNLPWDLVSLMGKILISNFFYVFVLPWLFWGSGVFWKWSWAI